MSNSFGARFGALVKERRSAMRPKLTQMELAIRAFGQETDHARISRLESGKIPEPKDEETVKPLAGALGITVAEIEACRRPHVPDAVQEELGLRRELLESLAARFEHDNPGASDRELREYLADKAEELKDLQGRIEELKALVPQFDNSMPELEEAIERGDFDRAQTLLAEAQESVDTAALTGLRIASEVRARRGDVALLAHDPDTAYEHYREAAALLDGLAHLEAIELRNVFAERILRNEHTHGRLAIQKARCLIEKNVSTLEHSDEDHESIQLIASQRNNLGIILCKEGEDTPGKLGAELIQRAVNLYESIIPIWGKYNQPYEWAMLQNNLGNALDALGRRLVWTHGATLIARSVFCYEGTLTVWTESERPHDWASAQSNLGNSLSALGERNYQNNGKIYLQRAINAYHLALKVWNHENHSENLLKILNNLSIAYELSAARTPGTESSKFALKSVEIYQALLEQWTEDCFPVRWAATQSNLGNALKILSKTAQTVHRSTLIRRAIESYTASLRVRTKEEQPVRWAMTMENIGLALEEIAKVNADRAEEELVAGLEALDAALTVFDPEHMGYNHAKCSVNRERVAARLAALREEG